jgi:hypothetical protein
MEVDCIGTGCAGSGGVERAQNGKGFMTQDGLRTSHQAKTMQGTVHANYRRRVSTFKEPAFCRWKSSGCPLRVRLGRPGLPLLGLCNGSTSLNVSQT